MTDEVEIRWRNYAATLDMYKHLSDIRFKLIALVPVVSGFAIGLIANDVPEFQAAPIPRMLAGILGLGVTLGIVIYDQRNSQLYNRLSAHGGELEQTLELESGIFRRRPERSLKLLGVIAVWHDRGLAMIYGVVLGAWTFPVVAGALWLIGARAEMSVPRTSALFSAVAALAFILELHRLDREATSNASSHTKTDRSEQRSETIEARRRPDFDRYRDRGSFPPRSQTLPPRYPRSRRSLNEPDDLDAEGSARCPLVLCDSMSAVPPAGRWRC